MPGKWWNINGRYLHTLINSNNTKVTVLMIIVLTVTIVLLMCTTDSGWLEAISFMPERSILST